jgi:hypothetical protein
VDRRIKGGEVMNEYRISYYLRDMYHTYIMEAKNEAEAITRAVNRLPEGSKEIMHHFSIEKYVQKWN